MAVGLASGVAAKILDALCRSVAWTEPADFYVKLHIGDPGAAGAGNVAGETTRQQAVFGAASGGVIANSGAVTWTNLAANETLSHVSFWSASSGGTFLGSDDLATPRAVLIGDTFTIAIGDWTSR